MLTPTGVTTTVFNNAMKADAPTHIKLVVGGVTLYTDEDIDSNSGISLLEYLNSDEDLIVGRCMTRELTINFLQTDANKDPYTDLINGFEYYVGAEIDEEIIWIKLGFFIPYEPEQYPDNGIRTLIAHDRMDVFNYPAEDWLKNLTFPMTVGEMFSSICSYRQVQAGDTTDALSNIWNRSFAENPIKNTGVMCRDVLEAISEACGCYVRIGASESCDLVWYKSVPYGYSLHGDDIFRRVTKAYPVGVNGINVKNTEDDVGVLYPSNAILNIYMIVDNPFLTTDNDTDVTNYIVPLYTRLNSSIHLPADVTCIGNPLIEPGDRIVLYRQEGEEDSSALYIFAKESHWNGSLTDRYYSTGNKTRNTYSSNVRQKLAEGGRYHIFKNDIDQLYSEIADVEGDVTLIDQKADAIALSAGKKARMWYSNTAPTGTTAEPLVANVDYWIDTAHDRKLMRWTGDAWAAADDISKYTKYSGIDIGQNGVDITGSKYVKIQSGGSFLVDATDFKIDSANKLMKAGQWTFDNKGLFWDGNNAKIQFAYDSDRKTMNNGFGIYYKADPTNNKWSTELCLVSSGSLDKLLLESHNGIPHYFTLRPSGDGYCSLGLENYRYSDVWSQFVYTYGLWITGGANGIVYQGTKANSRLIDFWDNTADAYGNGILIGDGGVVIIGAGESAAQVRSNSGATAGTETLYLAADSDVKILSNVQNGYSSRKEFTFGTNGNLTAPGRLYQNGNQAVPLSDTWRGFQTKQYQYTYTIPANGGLQIPASSFLGNNAPSGYTPVAMAYFNTSDSNIEAYYLDATATGNGTMVALHNRANAQISHPMAIKILYLQN